MRSCFRYISSLLVLAALFAACQAAAGEEVIRNFQSEVRIREDLVIEVREEITAVAAGIDIKRGIIRDYPLREPNSRDKIIFKVVSASVDGVPLGKVEVMREGDVASVVLGDRNKTLSKGEHTFVLIYETSPHVFPQSGFDEFRWNVTGDWGFTIEKAACRVILPPGSAVREAIGWSGRPGSRDHQAEVEILENGVLFTTAQALAPNDGFSVGVAYVPGSKPAGSETPPPSDSDVTSRSIMRERGQPARQGIVEEKPDPPMEKPDRWYHQLQDWWSGVLWSFRSNGYFVVFISFLYYLAVWYFFGRDPKPGVVIPLFYPPKADGEGRPIDSGDESLCVSPAATEYVMTDKKRLDKRGFSSLFLSLAVRGLARIAKDDAQRFVVTAIENGEALKKASPEEREVYKQLAGVGEAGLLVSSANHATFSSMHRAAEAQLDLRYPELWSFNGALRTVNWLCVFPLGLAYTLDVPYEISGLAPIILAPVAALIFIFRKSNAVARARTVHIIGRLLYVVGLGAIVFALFSGCGVIVLIILAVALLMSGFLDMDQGINLAAILVFLMPLYFNRYMGAPTAAGRALMDRLDGLKMYIETAEMSRLAAFNPPEDTPEVFERLLPYAMVFSLERTWCNRFAEHMAAGLTASGNIPSESLTGDGMSVFVGDFMRQTSSAEIAPRSSGSGGYASDDRGGGGSWFSSSGSSSGGGSVGGGRGGGGGRGF